MESVKSESLPLHSSTPSNEWSPIETLGSDLGMLLHCCLTSCPSSPLLRTHRDFAVCMYNKKELAVLRSVCTVCQSRGKQIRIHVQRKTQSSDAFQSAPAAWRVAMRAARARVRHVPATTTPESPHLPVTRVTSRSATSSPTPTASVTRSLMAKSLWF